MPKMKTTRCAAKRFKRTGSGYKHKRTGVNHLNSKMKQKRKRQLRGFDDVSPHDEARVKKLLPYG